MQVTSIPESERLRYETMIIGNARRFGLSPEDYLRKIWYHEQASRVGEYVAISMVDWLLRFLPPEEVMDESQEEKA